MPRKMFLWAPLAIVAMLVFVIVGGEGVRLLWNWLAPDLFGLRAITFWQAVGLLALCRILFGGFRAHGMSRSGVRRRIAERVAERAADRMTPDELGRFRQRVVERWGAEAWPGPGEPRKD